MSACYPLQSAKGFSLVEAMISLLLLLVVSSATFSGLLACQKAYQSLDQKADMYSGMRGTTEMMTQEIGQAGLLNFAGATLASAIIGNSGAQSVGLSSTNGIFVGEKLLIDAGTSQETVAITDIHGNSVTGIFQHSHSKNAPVNGLGVFPQGILSSSSGSQLQMFGDINADGILVYVQYDCDTNAGTLSRSVTPISATNINPSQVVLQGLTASPDGSPCFQYSTVTAGGFTFVTSVGVTLTIQTAQADLQTEQHPTMTKVFSNLASRNILAALNLANSGIPNRLQPTPPGLPLQ